MGETVFTVSQGSVIGPILFDIFLSNLFLEANKIEMESYADYIVLYKVCVNIDALSETLVSVGKSLQWF